MATMCAAIAGRSQRESPPKNADACRCNVAHARPDGDVGRMNRPRRSIRRPHEGVYARIGVSRLHGVGVVAIRAIPKGTLVFAGEDERAVWLDRAWVRTLPPAMRALYEDFGMVDGPRIGVPQSFNRLSVGWYVNHAAKPNLVAGDDGRFRALRRIRAGEELTADYRTFCGEELEFEVRIGKGSTRARARA